ncbi:MAG: GlsB/YeaQ/YmgE family stress response membrane protein [Rhodanobacter sp.]
MIFTLIRARSAHTWEFAMSGEALIIFLLIGAIAGWLAGVLVRGFGFGLLGNIVVGIIGAFIAGWLLPRLGVSFQLGNPIVTSIIYAMIGAVVLLVLIGLIRRR